jgi:hypothetical protein
VANDSDAKARAVPGGRRLYRFDPWQRRFDPVPVDLGLNDAQSATQFVAIGSDAFVWLDQRAAGPVLHGVRLGTRSIFSNDLDLIQERDAEDKTRPAHLVPDRAAGSAPSYDSVNASLSFEASEPGLATSCVWLADAEFSDFSAKIEFASNVLPGLRLGSLWLSDPASTAHERACALPAPADAQGGTLSLERKGTHLALSLGVVRTECTVSDVRLPIALCASDLGAVSVTRLRVTRSD